MIIKHNKDINSLNRILECAENEYQKYCTSDSLPIVFIIGVARSGTTLAHQLLTETGMFSYVDNIVARFPLAPSIGLQISNLLLKDEVIGNQKFVSEYGHTFGFKQPHEFGYFWNRWFDFGQESHNLPDDLLKKVNVFDLKKTLLSMQSVFNLPLLFKNNTWCTLQASFLSKHFSNAYFVVCRRDPVYAAQSHLLGREKNHNDRKKWWSIKPSTFEKIKDLSVWDQIASQVIHIEQEMDLELKNIKSERIIEFPYSGVCENPLNYVTQVLEKIGYNVDREKLKSSIPSSFKSNDIQKLGDNDWLKLTEAIQYIYSDL